MGSDADETLSADTCRRCSATAARSFAARGVSGIARGVNGCTAAAESTRTQPISTNQTAQRWARRMRDNLVKRSPSGVFYINRNKPRS